MKLVDWLEEKVTNDPRALRWFEEKGSTAVRHAKPPASRPDSAEIYLVATGFRGRVGDDEDEA